MLNAVPDIIFEACVDSVASARAALAGGASRLELCEALSEGGLTPSSGKIAAVAALCAASLGRAELCVLVRPRAGDFCYSAEDLAVACADCASLARTPGVSRVVVGALTPAGDVDETALTALLAAASPLRATFHRAVDMARDPVAAVRTLAAHAAVVGVLSSGGAQSALAGATTLNAMVTAAAAATPARAAAGAPPLTIIAAGGVGPVNAAAIVAESHVRELHGSARGPPVHGSMVFRRLAPPIFMGADRLHTAAGDAPTEYCTRTTDSSIVAAVVAAARATTAAATLQAESAPDVNS